MVLISLVALALAAYSVWRVLKIEKQSLVVTGLAGDKTDQVSQLRQSIQGVDSKLNDFIDLIMQGAPQDPTPSMQPMNSPLSSSPVGTVHCDGDVCTITTKPLESDLAPTSMPPFPPFGGMPSGLSMADQMLGCLVNMMTVPDAVVSSSKVSQVEEMPDEPAPQLESVTPAPEPESVVN